MSRPFITGGPKRYAHQRRGLQKMIRTGGITALLYDPGLGKTAVVLDYASILALKSPKGEARILVICPLAAVDTWVMQTSVFASPEVNFWAEALGGSLKQRAEALAARGGFPYKGTRSREKAHPKAVHGDKAYAWDTRATGRDLPVTRTEGPDGVPGPKMVLEVLNLDTFSRRDTVGSKTMADVMLDAVRRFEPDLVVVDESHKIKSPMGNSSRLLGRISKIVRRRVILTGTVMPAGPLDVFGQWRFLEPYAFGDPARDGSVKAATFGSFKSRYAVLGGWMGREVTGYRNLDEMQRIMSINADVARKEDALDLPPTTDADLQVYLSPSESKAYAEMKEQLATQLNDGSLASVPNRLTQMLRLRQITSGHLPSDGGPVRDLGHSKAKTIASHVNDSLIGEKRIVIFALFTPEIDALTSALSVKGTEVMTITGATPGEDRIAMRKRFGSDDPQRMVMVAQIKTMSVAVNELVTANHAIFASLSQQRDDLIQARDRLNRIGQERPVTFWYAMVPGTVDEVILDSHRKGTDLETAVLEHIKGEGSV